MVISVSILLFLCLILYQVVIIHILAEGGIQQSSDRNPTASETTPLLQGRFTTSLASRPSPCVHYVCVYTFWGFKGSMDPLDS